MKEKPNKAQGELKNKLDVMKKRMKIRAEVTFKDRRLSKDEKKRLMELKTFDAGVSKEQLSINTAQKSLPFQRMYEEGICQVTDTFFCKIIEFNDINYELLEVEERGEVLEEYSKFINYFDTVLINFHSF